MTPIPTWMWGKGEEGGERKEKGGKKYISKYGIVTRTTGVKEMATLTKANIPVFGFIWFWKKQGRLRKMQKKTGPTLIVKSTYKVPF